MKDKLIGFVLSTYLALIGCSSIQKTSGTTELMHGNQTSTLDSRLYSPLPLNTSLFLRNRSSLDYEGNSNQFTLVDFGYSITEEFGIFYETQFPSNNKPTFNVGALYFSQLEENLSLLVSPLLGVKSDPDLTLQIRLKYNPLISEDVNFFSQIEIFNSFTENDHQFSIERFRVGLEKEGYVGGIALDLEQIGSNFDSLYNIGIFLQKNF